VGLEPPTEKGANQSSPGRPTKATIAKNIVGEAERINISKSHSRSGGAVANKTGYQCTPATTIFDLGFFDGADAARYLNEGYCVVGVEADPDLIAEAKTNFASWIAFGQLRLANIAVAPSDDVKQWTTFYRNKCTKEWNSFYQTVGCRSCKPPHKVIAPDQPGSSCEAVPVMAVSCSWIFQTYGLPHYLKLDIEGAEPGCFDALEALGQGRKEPTFVSAEITEVGYIDALHSLGYGGFKLARQDTHHSGTSSTSGPWGQNSMDCRTGANWRTYDDARKEMEGILEKTFSANDPCPGGVIPIHSKAANSNTTYMWYDVHAVLSGPAR